MSQVVHQNGVPRVMHATCPRNGVVDWREPMETVQAMQTYDTPKTTDTIHTRKSIYTNDYCSAACSTWCSCCLSAGISPHATMADWNTYTGHSLSPLLLPLSRDHLDTIHSFIPEDDVFTLPPISTIPTDMSNDNNPTSMLHSSSTNSIDTELTDMPTFSTDLSTSIQPHRRDTPRPTTDRQATRREKHRSADLMRRRRMTQLINEMHKLTKNSVVTDQTSVLAAGVDALRNMQAQIDQLTKRVNFYQQSPQNMMSYLYNQHLCDIKAMHPSLDTLGIAIERTTVGAVVIDMNLTCARVCGCKREAVVGYSLSNRPMQGTVYHMTTDHVAVYKELCSAQRGTDVYLSSSAPYYGKKTTKMGLKDTPARTGQAFDHVFEQRVAFEILCVYDYDSDYIVEAMLTCTPVFAADDTPDHLVFMSTNDTRRKYRRRLSVLVN